MNYWRFAGTSEKVHEEARLDAGLVAVTVTVRISALSSIPAGAVQVAAVVKVGSSPSDAGVAASGDEPADADHAKVTWPSPGSWATAANFTAFPPLAKLSD